MSANRFILAGISIASLSACASIPDVDYNYYLPKLSLVVTVSQTVDCTQDKMSLIIVNSGTVTPTYSSDLSRGPYHVNIRAIEGAFSGFADSDANFGFYDDGRLKSVNQTTTGEGETIIKSFVTLATTVAAFGALDKFGNRTGIPECTVVANWGQTKPVTLSYGTEVDFPGALKKPPFEPPQLHAPPYVIPIPPIGTSQALYDQLKSKLPALNLVIGGPTDAGSRALSEAAASGEIVNLTLETTAAADVAVTADTKKIWGGLITIPEGSTYDLPIPVAALFGMQKFTLSLNEAGAITAVEYGKNTGAAGAANAANAIAGALTPETPTAQAADLKAKADVIAQGQRLARCQSNPSQCQ